jgi:hypothetical protein
MRPVADLLRQYVAPGDRILDPFAGDASWGTVTNDSNKSTAAQFHMDALDFLATEPARGPFDVVLLDPNYSARQAREVYHGHGAHTQDRGYMKKVCDAIAPRVRMGGLAICCGWSGTGFGRARGFVPIDGLAVVHGHPRHATLVLVEQRFR